MPFQMTTWGDLKKRMTSQKVNLPRLAALAVRLTSDDLVEWQKEQLWSGKLSTGGFIRPPYAPVTRRIKRSKGQPTDRVTLKDTGAFYEGIFADTSLEGWTLGSRDGKTPLLVEKYTPKIFGLSKLSLRGYKADVEPVFIRECRKAIGI